MKILTSFVLILSFLIPLPALAWKEAPADSKEAVESTKYVTWEGGTDLDMLHQVKQDIRSAQDDKKIKTLHVTLMSPGGPAVIGIEIARQVRMASEKGLVIEIHGAGVVASAGTYIMAAGTPGKRFISRFTLFLVHSLQVGGGPFSAPSCGKFTKDAKTQDEKVINALLIMGRDMYVYLTGKPAAEVEEWLSCGYEVVGGGDAAVQLGMADIVE